MNDHASLNRCYRHVWSDATQSWMVAPETARRSGKGGRASRTLKAVVGVLAAVALSGGISALTHAQQAPPSATQLPVANAVAKGLVNITQTNTANSAVMNVNQASQAAVVNWNTFNVGQNAQVNFNQPNSSAVTLNRVLDNNPSQVWGRITAPGQVFISNANGVYFSPTSSVDVGALTATTHSISDDDFMAGKRTFTRDGATGKVLNEGNIKAALGGYVALLAPEVQNAGVIVAQAGTVALAAGEAITLNFDPSQKLTGITTTPSAIAALVENKLAVHAPDGQIILSAIALNKLHAGVVKNNGHLEATSLVHKGGTIVLEGDDITLGSDSKIDVTGPQGGGSVLVGGDWQGGGEIRQATRVTMEEGATIDASATENGDGGKVVLWSDVYNASSITQVSGTIYARGGMLSGDGGRIETSGHVLRVDASQGDAAAPHGASGLWLFDPYNVTIASADANGAFASDGVNTDTWTPIASASSILNTTIVSKLNAGTHVTVTTTGAGADAGNITVAAPIAASNASTGALSLIADGDIAINANINTGGNLVLKAAGNINQAGSTSVSTNTANVTYWSDSDNSGAGSITLSAGTSSNQTSIVTNGGHIVMGGGINPTTSSALGTNGIRLDGFTLLNAGAGNVSLRGTSTAATANGGVGLRLINSTITGYDINLVGQGPANTGGGTGGTKTTTTLTATHNINLGADMIVSGVNNDVTATAAGNISVDRAQTWSSNKLELSAGGNVSVNADLDASSGGGLTVRFGQSSTTGTGATYSVNGVSVKIALPSVANVSNFRWKKGTSGTDNELVFNNGYLAFTASANGLQNAGSTSAINSQGQLNQPNFYDLDTVNGTTVGRNAWYKLTYSGYSLNFQVGAGTSGSIWNGNNATVSSGSGAAGGYLDISQYMPGLGSGPGLGPKASGTILSVLPITISSQTAQLISRYVLGSGDAYLRSDTSVKAISGTISNVGLWVGTQDDYVGGNDGPTKTIGNFSGTGFTANTAVGQPASVLRVDEGGSGASVLFYSTDSSASATFSSCCSFTNATNINPANQAITQTSDGSYALYTGMGDLAAGATKGFTWFYVAAPSQKVNAVAQSVVSSLTTYSFSSPASQTYAYTGNAYSLATLWSSVSLNASSGSLLLQPGQATNGYSFVYAGNPVTSLTNAGTYRLQIALSSDIASNYLLNNAGAATLTITPAPLSISGSTVGPKTYDGTTTATVTPGVIDPSGFIGSETVGVTATGVFSSANAGARTVTPVYTLVNGTNGGLAQNYSITGISPINATISPANLILSGTKVYDGTTSIAGSTLTARGVGSQTFTVTGVGDASNLGSANVQTNTLISSITGLSLGTSSNGGLVANYNPLSLTGSTYSITPKPLTVSGITVTDRVYNGGTQATIGTGAATFAGLISGDDVTIDFSSAVGTFDTKNVGTAKPVSLTGLRLAGTSSGNYSFASSSSLTGNITRLNSVTWVGGTTGNWFDPANWAGGAVPDLANVANVVIPVGTTVSFGSSVIAPATAGTVQIDSINAGLSSFGGLNMSAGTLQIGAGNANLYSLTHTGGTLSVGSDLNVEDAFSQTASGSISVTGNATLTDTSGGVALGALTVGGNLALQSSGGSITQLGALRVTGTSALTSTGGNITLTNASNDFTGAVSASGGSISLRDANALTLGTLTSLGSTSITTAGDLSFGSTVIRDNLSVTTGNGSISQTQTIGVSGGLTLNAGTGAVNLADASNIFGSTPVVQAASINLARGMPYSLTTTVTSDPQKPVFTGQAPINSTVSIYDNGTLIATVPTDNAGNWRYESTAFMIPGTHAITLKASSAVGTSGLYSPAPVTVNARFDALNMVGAALQGQQAPLAVATPAVAAGQSIFASADQLMGMSPQQIQAMTPQQTAMFTPTQLASLDPVQIASFSPAQLASLSVQQVAAISRVSTLSFEQVQTLSPAQVASMEPTQFANMNAAEIASLGDMQLLALTPNQVAAIAPAGLAAITPEQLSVLNTNLTQNLSPEQFGSMTALQLVSLTDSQVSALSPVQLQQLNATQLSVLTVEQKAAMTPLQLLAIGEPSRIQVAELSHQEISSLTAQQVQNLLPEQLQSLSGLQVRALSVAQVVAMGSQQVEALSPVQLQALTTEQLSSMSLVQAASLTESQLAVMSPLQLNALPKGGVLPLTVLGDVRVAATGIEFEKRMDSLDVRVTDMAPPPIVTTADNMPTELTSFAVTTAEQQVVEFKGAISNKQLIIAASTDMAKTLTRLDMARVVRAAVAELMEGKKSDPSELTGVVLDLR